MKTIFFLLFPLLLWGQFEVNVLEYEQPYWWVIDEKPVDVVRTDDYLIPESALEFINRIDKPQYKTGQHGLVVDSVGALCPWITWRLQPYFSFQVDVILSPDEFQAFEPRLLDEDLMYYVHGGNRDALNIAERGYFGQIHIPGHIGKLMRDYRFVPASHALYITENPVNGGWYRRILKNGMAIAARDLPNNRIHVSMARFIEYDPF